MIRSAVISLLIIIASIFAFTFIDDNSVNEAGPCDESRTYRVGEIDSRFNITENQVKNVMEEVEEVWFEAFGKELLTYRENGQISIDFIYSEQQKLFEEERSTSNRIQGKDQQFSTQKRKYERISRQYEENLEQYKIMLGKFNDMVDSHNTLIAGLRGQKLSPEQQQKIKENEEKINSFKSRLDQKQSEVETLRKRVNTQADELNRLNAQRNELVSEYNSQFGEPKKFDQGRYVREGSNERIYVYQFSDIQSLKAVLAHEAGHALGLNHVDNPSSVMYELMSEQNIRDIKLSNEDIEALRERCTE